MKTFLMWLFKGGVDSHLGFELRREEATTTEINDKNTCAIWHLGVVLKLEPCPAKTLQ